MRKSHTSIDTRAIFLFYGFIQHGYSSKMYGVISSLLCLLLEGADKQVEKILDCKSFYAWMFGGCNVIIFPKEEVDGYFIA